MENLYTITPDTDHGNLGFKIPSSVADALKNQEVLLNTVISSGGITVWVQFLEPKEYAHATYDLETAGQILTAAKSRPKESVASSSRGKLVAFDSTARRDMLPPKEIAILKAQLGRVTADASSSRKGKEKVVQMSFETARARVSMRNLDTHRIQGVLNKYPQDSLVRQDFKRVDDLDFAARVYTVAENLGHAKIMSRITTGGLAIGGCYSLQEWWEHATAPQRVRVLSSAKKLSGSYDPDRISRIACPFQDAEPRETSDEDSADDW